LFPSTKRTARSDTGRSSPKTKTPACGRSQTPGGLILVPRKVPGSPKSHYICRYLSIVLISLRGRRLRDPEGHPHAPMGRPSLMAARCRPPTVTPPSHLGGDKLPQPRSRAKVGQISQSDYYLPYLKLLKEEKKDRIRGLASTEPLAKAWLELVESGWVKKLGADRPGQTGLLRP